MAQPYPKTHLPNLIILFQYSNCRRCLSSHKNLIFVSKSLSNNSFLMNYKTLKSIISSFSSSSIHRRVYPIFIRFSLIQEGRGNFTKVVVAFFRITRRSVQVERRRIEIKDRSTFIKTTYLMLLF